MQVPNAAFEDRTQYLLAPEGGAVYTAADLERDFGAVEWRGCIRTAPDERVVLASGNVLDRLTDDPVPGMRWPVNFVRPHVSTLSFSGNTSGFNGDADALTAGLSIISGDILDCDVDDGASGTFNNPYLNRDHACKNSSTSNAFNIIEACVSDPNEFAYFENGGEACPWRDDFLPWTEIRPISGPNMNCPAAMLGLSDNRSQIIEKLDEMYPVPPGTHADLGLMWGLRMLSPQTEWANFFGQDRPANYDDAGARKILVLLTDGENFYPRLIEGYYGCREDRDNRRGSAGSCFVPDNIGVTSRDALDELMLDSCEAIREDYDIEIFTIAVDISSSRTINLLAECADDPNKAFNISAAEIGAAFESIAAREVRLTQ